MSKASHAAPWSAATRSWLSERVLLSIILLAALLLPSLNSNLFSSIKDRVALSPYEKAKLAKELLRCSRLHLKPINQFSQRNQSDRFVHGTPPQFISNVTVWTGLDQGREMLQGMDVILANGLVHSLAPTGMLDVPLGAKIHHGHGAYLTPGIFDMHSHIGVDSAPGLAGSDDTNSLKQPIMPYLRSVDGINTHDLSFRRSVAGGVTTSLILPGSALNMGGQAFVIKLRSVASNTPDEMVLEPPYSLIGDKHWPMGAPPRLRHMKAACGENIKRVFKSVRMDLAWNFRSSFDKARSIKNAQDSYCSRVMAKNSQVGARDLFPEELEWELLVDLLRGKVALNAHCYETTDLAALVRHSNEFEFPIAAVHHAHEAYLVTDLLKTTYGGAPAAAIFATNARYKREAWRGSEYAALLLSKNNITVITKSDHPVLDSRYLLFEAQQAHHFGLPAHLALAAVTTNPARVAGFSHRLGYLQPGYDADVVLWDSHPLKLGSTPLRVFIDGISQFEQAFLAKPISIAPLADSIASIPQSKDFDKLVERGGNDYGDDIIDARPRKIVSSVHFKNVKAVHLSSLELVDGLRAVTPSGGGDGNFDVVFENGVIVCVNYACPKSDATTIDLKGGSITPPLTTYGTYVGTLEIIAERSTADGEAKGLPPFSKEKDLEPLALAADGLSFDGKHLSIAHESGVGFAVGRIASDGFVQGLSVAFRTGASSILEDGAIVKSIVAIQVGISRSKTSTISSQIAGLRQLLISGHESATKSDSHAAVDDYWRQVVEGTLPLVIDGSKADHIAQIIKLKSFIESLSSAGGSIQLVISGAQEAYLLADELAQAKIGVILNPPRSYPADFDSRRASPGPPLVSISGPAVLHRAGVKLAIGVPEEWQTRTLMWEAAWISATSTGIISHLDALRFVTSNLQELLGHKAKAAASYGDGSRDEFVAWENDPFEFGSRPVAISSVDGRRVELFL